MKKTSISNISHIARIITEIEVIKSSLDTFNINDSATLKKSAIVQRACTQCITTIESGKRLLGEDEKIYLPCFYSIDLKRTRDIASHDYGSVDMNIVYRICTKLTDRHILQELQQELERLEKISAEELGKGEQRNN